MSKFHVPVIVEVECGSIEEARRLAYRAIEMNYWREINKQYGDHTPACARAFAQEGADKCGCGYDKVEDTAPDKQMSLFMADDSATAHNGQRIVFLHPEDVPSDYSPEEYEEKLTQEED